VKRLTLLPEEIEEVTGYKHKPKQAMALTQMGIRFRINPAGDVIVLHSDMSAGKDRAITTNEPRLEGL